jgi:hypothetical protein
MSKVCKCAVQDCSAGSGKSSARQAGGSSDPLRDEL